MNNGNNLRLIRETRGLSQRAFHRLLKESGARICLRTISRHEAGETSISADQLARYARVLDVSMEEIAN